MYQRVPSVGHDVVNTLISDVRRFVDKQVRVYGEERARQQYGFIPSDYVAQFVKYVFTFWALKRTNDFE